MTDSYKPLTTNELKANYGIVDGVPTYQDFYEAKDVLSAYKGLREDIRDLYRHFDKPSVWRASNDEVCDMCEEECLRLIDKWFPVFFVEQKEGED